MKSKKLTSLLFGCLLAVTGMAQVPQGISYQAVLRNGSGVIEANTTGTLGLAILQGSSSGTVVYSETHAVTSNGFGLVNVTLGGGTATSGTFGSIDWSTGAYWVRTSFNGTELGTSKLQSVPFALYAPNTAFNGTVNKLVRFTSPTTGESSQVFDNGTLVGIGTSTPEAQLEIKYNSTATSPQLKLSRPNEGYSRIHFQNTNTGAWVLAGSKGTTAANSLFNVFYSEGVNGNGGSDIMRISGLGKVGINGTDPTSTSVYDGMLGIKQDGSANALSLVSANATEGKWGFYVGAQFYMYQNNTSIGNFNKTSGAYSSTSDIRLKENIKPAGAVLGLVKDVQVMRYTYKRDEEHRPQLGYLAQELEKQFPEFVTKPEEIEGKESVYTVNYAGMSAVAIKAIQEQQELIDAMAKTIEELKARVGQLEAR